MRRYKIIKTATKILIGFSIFAVLVVIASTQIYLKADESTKCTPDLNGDYINICPTDYNEIGPLLDRGLEFLEWFIGTIALIGFMISGILFGISGGDPEKAKRAKMGMIYTSIGIFISLLALTLTKAGFGLFK